MPTKVIGVILATGLAALVLVACSGSEETAGRIDGGERVIQIQAFDSLAFEPDAVSVEPGETVRFVVSNRGAALHEFILAPPQVQMAHGEHATPTGHEEHGETKGEIHLAALEVEPGATEEAVVTFEEEGEVIFACHQPGHYAGGMFGTVRVG
jgi:uncharacterized cupredoxin-like copper-binding protein